jgi:hypothetical protein
VTQPERTHDAREGSGDPATDPAAAGERSFAEPDADGGAVPDGADGADGPADGGGDATG